MNDSERLAMAAHLHVALRRKVGRVTDTEWMAGNREYGLAMVDLALAHAHEHMDQELGSLALRFGAAMTSLRPARRPGQRAEAGAWSDSLAPQARDTRPAETRIPEARPADTRPADTRPADTRPPETRPFRDSRGPASEWPTGPQTVLPSGWADSTATPAPPDAPMPLRRGRYVGGLR
ncbi:hypothetical protein CCO03_15235 [Comamonas serinivorans]|uniref:Uncharacterized protein n=1 Tax=Comamonas serinivorans TaxID=1082851 RepID=A0A1Y0EQZ7_9BURK|nr:hypothetical protein CCO03_15235 [Comamonas serinivorans]